MRFDFGKNWASYAKKINEVRIEEAVKNLCRLLGKTTLEGESFFDIGSGSGLHSLAALRLGAARVEAIDIDADSVRTTEALLEKYVPKS
ncbi:MAG: 50S ribosomal protein L11 methyltransferase [Desulfacinum sp.]|nr:50S ribosomal protein L11 methyltransferase [Desulfacinum sp.]